MTKRRLPVVSGRLFFGYFVVLPMIVKIAKTRALARTMLAPTGVSNRIESNVPPIKHSTETVTELMITAL